MDLPEDIAGSSPATETNTAAPADQTTTPATTPEVEKSAESTPAPSSETAEGDALFAAVQAAMGPSSEGEEPTAPNAGEAPAQTTEETTAQPGEDPDAKLPFSSHPRWKEVYAEARRARELAPHAQAWQAFQGNLARAGLSRDEVNEGLGIMALLKRHDDRASLERARELIADHLHNLDLALGNVIPDDIAARIETGEVAEDAALELARARAEANRLRSVREAQVQQTQVEQFQQHTNQVLYDLQVWEERVRASDPTYESKKELYRVAMADAVRQNGGFPASSQDAIALAERARATVDRAFAGRPAPRPTPKTPTSTATSRAASVNPNHGKSLEDVIASALRG